MKLVATLDSKNKITSFVGNEETINLKGGENFRTIVKSHAELIVGHQIELDADGKPSLSDDDLYVLEQSFGVLNTLQGSTRRNARRLLRKEARAVESINAARQRISDTRWTIDRARLCHIAAGEIDEKSRLGARLEKPTSTMFHKLMEDVIAGNELRLYDSKASADDFVLSFRDASIFVIEHDWAAAFEGASDYIGGEIQMPDDTCAFEFRISGVPIIALVAEAEPGLMIQLALLTSVGWIFCPPVEFKNGKLMGAYTIAGTPYNDNMFDTFIPEFRKVAINQIRAIAIALDAEVASTSIIRADYKLNHAREKRGKLPLYDYHVVSLARRARAEPLPRDPDAEPGTRKRLHFVRGHWRHYENSKSWVRWHLRGDPDLGFIDKHYKL